MQRSIAGLQRKIGRARAEEADRQHHDDHRRGDEEKDARRAEFAEQKRDDEGR